MSQTTPAGPRDWTRVYGQDPEQLLEKSFPVPEDVYVDELLARMKSPVRREGMERFEGANGCTAWAYAKSGRPEKTGEDSLGQPMVKADLILSWNPTIRSYRGAFYDFLAYEDEQARSGASRSR